VEPYAITIVDAHEGFEQSEGSQMVFGTVKNSLFKVNVVNTLNDMPTDLLQGD
jgi:hypothetical protein